MAGVSNLEVNRFWSWPAGPAPMVLHPGLHLFGKVCAVVQRIEDLHLATNKGFYKFLHAGPDSRLI